MKSRVVVKLSGSLFELEGVRDRLQEFTQVFREHREAGGELVLVAGGGRMARDYIRAARSLGADEATLDELGIWVARLNAALMIAALGEAAYPRVAETLEEAAQYLLSGHIVMVGGLHPGHSTNAVAALIAERIKAEKLINTTDVEGVYTADPKQDPSARLLEEIKVEELARLLEGGSIQAGTYELMDPLALRIIQRSRIPTLIVKCSPNTLAAALKGEKVGTRLRV